MTRLFTSKLLLALLASIIVLAIIASLTLRSRMQVSWPEKVIMDSFSTIQRYLYLPAAKVSDTIVSFQKLKNLYQENEVLKSNLNNYAQLKVQVTELQQQNKQLQDALGFKRANTGYNVLPAVVTGHSINTWSSVIQINVGSRDGVQKDMPVIDLHGYLVGRVTDVADISCKVLLITDTEKNGISAQVKDGDHSAFGIVSGSSQEGTVKMGFISRESKIDIGETVVTSEFSNLFPKGLIIGQITKLLNDETGLTKTVLVKPAADIDHLENVFVVFQAKS